MSKKEKTTSSGSQTNTASAYTRGRIQDSTNRVRDMMSGGFQPYEGQRVAGLNETEQSARDQFSQNQGQGMGMLQDAAGVARGASQYGADQFTQDVQGFQNPFIQSVIDANSKDMRRDGDIAQAGVNAGATSAGAFGGSRHGVQAAQMEDDTLDRMALMSANLRSDGYNQASNLAMQSQGLNLQGAGLLGNLGTSMDESNRANAGMLNQFGNQERGIEQAGMDAEYQDFLRGYEDPFRRAQIEMGLAGLTPMEMNSTSRGNSTTSSTDWGAIGGAGLQLLASSDRRCKTNVTFSHEKDGRKFYNYRYIWDNPLTRRIGLMAQDLLKTEPERVHMHQSGYLMVDYAGVEI